MILEHPGLVSPRPCLISRAGLHSGQKQNTRSLPLITKCMHLYRYRTQIAKMYFFDEIIFQLYQHLTKHKIASFPSLLVCEREGFSYSERPGRNYRSRYRPLPSSSRHYKEASILSYVKEDCIGGKPRRLVWGSDHRPVKTEAWQMHLELTSLSPNLSLPSVQCNFYVYICVCILPPISRVDQEPNVHSYKMMLICFLPWNNDVTAQRARTLVQWRQFCEH